MLDEIVASVEARLAPVIEAATELRAVALARPGARPFEPALRRPGISVVAEIKRRSPSRGVINADVIPAEQAQAYERGGAAAVSVLTERDHFEGSLGDLSEVRAAIGLPVLRKDFIVHPAQVWESRAAGADAVLLIVAILDDPVLRDLWDTAREAGIAALVEVHTEADADRAMQLGARIIGVNNRDLATFDVDLTTAERIRPMLGDDVVTVAESGVSHPGGAARMGAAGYDAILVGEAAMRADDPAGLIADIRSAR